MRYSCPLYKRKFERNSSVLFFSFCSVPYRSAMSFGLENANTFVVDLQKSCRYPKLGNYVFNTHPLFPQKLFLFAFLAVVLACLLLAQFLAFFFEHTQAVFLPARTETRARVQLRQRRRTHTTLTKGQKNDLLQRQRNIYRVSKFLRRSRKTTHFCLASISRRSSSCLSNSCRSCFIR